MKRTAPRVAGLLAALVAMPMARAGATVLSDSQIFSQFNAYDDTQNSGLVYVSCNYLSSVPSFTFDFQFGGSDGPLIKVPVDEIIQNDVQPLMATSNSSAGSAARQSRLQ